MKLLIVLIHDEPAIRELLAEMLKAWMRNVVSVEKVGYAARLPGPMKRWIDEADVFVLGLERHYKEGRCAEGVDVAESLFRLGRKVLIVASECNANRLGVPFYWDIASEKPYLETLKAVIDSPVPGLPERERVLSFFGKRRHKPVGHGGSNIELSQPVQTISKVPRSVARKIE